MSILAKTELDPRAQDLRGKRFGRLVVQSFAGYCPKAAWWCLCDCGLGKRISASNITNGHTQSCGCLALEARITSGRKSKKHGKEKTPEYRAWAAMKYRCNNKNCREYSNYGGRGITICERWLNSFENFYEDMGPRPTNDHSLDRINNNGNYEPGNCRWATRKTQTRNTRKNTLVTFGDETKTLSEWAELTGITITTLLWRLKMWPLEKALTHPPRNYTMKGKSD